MGIFKKGGWLDRTWDDVKPSEPEKPVEKPDIPAPPKGNPPWLVLARKDIGVQERRGGETKRIIEYHSHTTLKATEDEVAWCASACCCWLEEAGLKSPRNAWAQSFAAWNGFEKLSHPIHGCFCVYRWSPDSGHVNIYDATSKYPFGCVGGNQADDDSGGQVSLADYSKKQDSVIGYMWPKGFPKTSEVSVDSTGSPQPGWLPDYTVYLKEHISDEILHSDIESLLPSISPEAKRDAFVAIFRAIAYAESSLNPTDRYVEDGLGRDAVTGEQNTSEGLFQVSYQDAKYYGCQFDWAKDKVLSRTSPNKTIFNGIKNLDCSMRIFTKLIRNHPHETFEQIGARYWSVLQRDRSGYKRFREYLRNHH